jgi:hypothetical protein
MQLYATVCNCMQLCATVCNLYSPHLEPAAATAASASPPSSPPTLKLDCERKNPRCSGGNKL